MVNVNLKCVYSKVNEDTMLTSSIMSSFRFFNVDQTNEGKSAAVKKPQIFTKKTLSL
jgi:hypothetical protein